VEALAKKVEALAEDVSDCASALAEDGAIEESRHASRAARFLLKAAAALQEAGI